MKERVKRKLWKDDDMVSAMKAVLEGGMKCATAARLHKVPRKSLKTG